MKHFLRTEQLLISTFLICGIPPLYATPIPPASCETPASIGCIYGLTPNVSGCPINGTSALPTGGWGAIAVVEALDNPDASSDLNTFSTFFGLPTASLQIIYSPAAPSTSPLPAGCQNLLPTTSVPRSCNTGSGNPCDEHVLDLEWAHAMAPNAKLIMVEAPNDNIWDKMYAVCYAAQAVAAAGGGIVSMSWSTSEFPQELGYDRYFQSTPNVLFVGSSGDYSAPANYPSASPYVISAGGTHINRNQGIYVSQSAWSMDPSAPPGSKNGGSGGPSLYEPRPAYQNSVMKIVGAMRGTPDIAFEADPNSGVCVYSTEHSPSGWFRDGGTSLSAPALSGIINAANHRASSTTDELTYIYNNALKNYHAYWYDITDGNNGYPALVGYDFTTGLGSPVGYNGK
jgi:subtilase family serine protease